MKNKKEMESIAKQKPKNKFGQYFTPEIVAEFMIGLANININSRILEPSCGEGIFLKLLEKQGFSDITAFEIDKELANEYSNVRYESFVSAEINKGFDLVIGNPPYIRWANLENELKQELQQNYLWNKYFNSLCDYLYIFILKSIELLNENGQLIFICPEYWLNTTHSLSLRNYMASQGNFECIYHFNEAPIFDNVSISTIIFKFVKSSKTIEYVDVIKFNARQKINCSLLLQLKEKTFITDTEYLKIPAFKINERWILASENIKNQLQILEKKCSKGQYGIGLFDMLNEPGYHTIGDFCDIGNGLVSGLDKAFQINAKDLNALEKKALLPVIKAKDLNPFYFNNISHYIFLEEGLDEKRLEIDYPHFFQHLQTFKVDLEKRYQYNRVINYWEWVFLRNLQLFKKEEARIFVPCKERISHKKYFRFAFAEAGFFPTQDVTAIFKKTKTKESIEFVLAYLNLPIVFDWLRYNGIVKGNIVEFSEKPIASIPFRAIDWTKKQEVVLHDKITDTVRRYLKNTSNNEHLNEINSLFEALFAL